METKRQFDVVKIVNILDESFSYKWDGETYPEIKAGEAVNLPAFLADYVTKKITDRAMIKDGKIKLLTDKRVTKEYGERILAGTVLEYDEAKLSTKEKVDKFMAENDVPQSYEDMTMADVRAAAREKGIEFKMTDKKVDLIAKLNGED